MQDLKRTGDECNDDDYGNSSNNRSTKINIESQLIIIIVIILMVMRMQVRAVRQKKKFDI